MVALFRRTMDALYLFCVVVSGFCLVAIAVIISYGVWRRYIENSAASWPEPLAILLTIILTFFGGAACYRTGTHMRVVLVRDSLPKALARATSLLSEALMVLLSLFMLIHGTGLVQTTWHQSVAEFPELRVGVSYLPIPVGGAMLLLFVLEYVLIGAPPEPADGKGGIPSTH